MTHLSFASGFRCVCGSFFFSLLPQQYPGALAGAILALAENHAPPGANPRDSIVKINAERDLAGSLRLAALDPCVEIRYCQTWATDLAFIAADRVAEVFECRESLRRVRHHCGRQTHVDALEIISILADESQVSLSSFGLTGSVGAGYDSAGSDVDVTVHGWYSCLRVESCVRRLISSGKFSVPDADLSWHVRQPFRRFFLGVGESVDGDTKVRLGLLERLGFKGVLRNRKFDVYFVDEEVSVPVMNEAILHVSEEVALRGVVADAKAALLKPSKFSLGLAERRQIEVFSLLNSARLLRSHDRIIVCGDLVRKSNGEEVLLLVDEARHWIELAV